jgi:hypothetical protein
MESNNARNLTYLLMESSMINILSGRTGYLKIEVKLVVKQQNVPEIY